MKFSKKILGLISVLVIMILCFVGCGKTETGSNEGSVSSATTSSDKSVVATINGKEVTREDVGQELVDAQKSVIEQYIYAELQKEFFNKVEVTEKEIDETIEKYKTNVGADNWDMYLMLYGGGSEEEFRKKLVDEIKLEKSVNEKAEKITIADSDLQAKYDENPNSYNIAVMDVVFLGAEQVDTAKAMYDDGKTIEEISKALNVEISKDEHCYFESDIVWEKPVSSLKVGDMNITTKDSGNYIVGKVVELNTGISNAKVKEDLTHIVKQEKAFEELNKEYQEFLKKSKASIFNEDIQLYVEEEQTPTQP